MNVVLLSGGVGGAKLARGLQQVLDRDELTVIGNVGDDLEILGLHVSPDLDSLLYALAGLNDEERGWGRSGETWQALEAASAWGGDAWFKLGDLDLGLHLVRSEALRRGEPLSEITGRFAELSQIGARLMPATNDPVRTHLWVDALGRWLTFQEWFVARAHADVVGALDYVGAAAARPAPGVVEAVERADAIVVAPSNPYVSILPILAVEGIRAAVAARRVTLAAVSPLIGGRAVKGPLDRMLSQLQGGTTPAHLLGAYAGALDVDLLVIDRADAPGNVDCQVLVAETMMQGREAERRLATAVVEALA